MDMGYQVSQILEVCARRCDTLLLTWPHLKDLVCERGRGESSFPEDLEEIIPVEILGVIQQTL